MNWIFTLAVASLVVSSPVASLAQDGRPRTQGAGTPDTMQLIPGERVRFLAPSIVAGTQYGVFRFIGGSNLVVDASTGKLPNWSIPLGELERLEARRGNGNAGARKGALIGMIAGGVLVGGGSYLAAGGTSNEYAGIGPLILTPAGVLAGAIAGTLIGRATSYSWIRVGIPERRDSTRRRERE